MLLKLKDNMRWHFYYKKWRASNCHNSTAPKNYFDHNCVIVGNYTYGELEVHHFGCENKLYIGNFCSIAPQVVFLLKDDHPVNLISTFPFKNKCLKKKGIEAVSKGDIVIDDDVWIGYGAIILSGVHIGQGAIVAAGAVVTKDVEPYSIVAGNPAKIKKYRFCKEIIQELVNVNYSLLTKEQVLKHETELYSTLFTCEQLKWMPKKK